MKTAQYIYTAATIAAAAGAAVAGPWLVWSIIGVDTIFHAAAISCAAAAGWWLVMAPAVWLHDKIFSC